MDILISKLLWESIVDFGKWSNWKYANTRPFKWYLGNYQNPKNKMSKLVKKFKIIKKHLVKKKKNIYIYIYFAGKEEKKESLVFQY